jgi:hypothetical protein
MTDETLITVYDFRLIQPPIENPQLPGYKATLAAIRELGGVALAGTAQQVPASDVDDEGRYRRLNTGWGALD